MYHKIFDPKQPERLAAFTAHLSDLKKRFPIVVPGEPLARGRLSVCLTFDDAYFDFYHTVYPLLTQLNMRVVLAIPTGFILEKTDCTPTMRLQTNFTLGLSDPTECLTKAPLCTWTEIREMVKRGHVIPASHSHSHQPLVDEKDVMTAKDCLTKQLPLSQTINTFVYPYGKTNARHHRLIRQHHAYGMRIGAALNRDWHTVNGLLYRVDAETMWPQYKTIGTSTLLSAGLKYGLNRVRGK